MFSADFANKLWNFESKPQ